MDGGHSTLDAFMSSRPRLSLLLLLLQAESAIFDGTSPILLIDGLASVLAARVGDIVRYKARGECIDQVCDHIAGHLHTPS